MIGASIFIFKKKDKVDNIISLNRICNYVPVFN